MNILQKMLGMPAAKFLSSKELFCGLMFELHRSKLTTHDGFAVRRARLVFAKEGIALVSHNHSEDRCQIFITESPDIEIIAGSGDAGGHGDPEPRAGKGSLILVWENGEVKKEGPWFRKIKFIIDELIHDLGESISEVAETTDKITMEDTDGQHDKDVNSAWAEDEESSGPDA